LSEPVEFIAKLAALVPKPRVNLTRFNGVFAPNSKHRARVTPAKRGKGSEPKACADGPEQTPSERRISMPLGATFEKGVRHRHRDLPGLWWGGADLLCLPEF
jgi:hypothetical protein